MNFCEKVRIQPGNIAFLLLPSPALHSLGPLKKKELVERTAVIGMKMQGQM